MAAKKKSAKRKMVKRPGTFTAWCKRHGFSGPSKACACAALRRGNSTVKKKAQFYFGMVLKQKAPERCKSGNKKRTRKK